MVSNPFKAGDKVVYYKGNECNYATGSVLDVVAVAREHVICAQRYVSGLIPLTGLPHTHFRAAIAGVDYPATKRDDNLPLGVAPNSGHLSDGSSVQKHSAGGLYPVVIWHRDKTLPGAGKYDVGLTWPDQAEPVWFRDYDSAINVAEAIKESLK